MRLLNSGILALVCLLQLQLGFSQDTNPTPSCTFSCPPENLASWKLVKRPFALGFDTFYTIFDCVYATLHPTPDDIVSERKCSYNKHTGSQALEAAGDNCPPQAIPCPDPPSPDSDAQSTQAHQEPLFSNIKGEEVLPWVEGGRYLLYLSEHPPSES
ncbi:hypothetical protein JR316_0012821 [Psilocybe cubensis]|uniref:Uncharacterized protein n=2 Tax=Psilocybe cubensis TaxID=181762 RepID=A0ACB8GFD1_PSICU|nr:hypothetical protein JR316_0012821 [Psilocybe cubensis]KAH9474363.1 hypothetical protein JR316_0012821 [Psilocybe cubensis]